MYKNKEFEYHYCMNNYNLIKNILLTFGLVLLVAGLGTLFTQLGMPWFDSLLKPTEWIPDYVIPIVWTVIYICIAVVLFLWTQNEGVPRQVVVLFVINGLLNILWCLIFFTFNSLFLGMVFILLNLVFAIYLLMSVEKYRTIYARAILIYPVWLLIATSLNIAVWILN